MQAPRALRYFAPWHPRGRNYAPRSIILRAAARAEPSRPWKEV